MYIYSYGLRYIALFFSIPDRKLEQKNFERIERKIFYLFQERHKKKPA